MMPLPGVSGGAGGLSFDGGTAESGASGGNASVNVGGFNVPQWSESFGYQSTNQPLSNDLGPYVLGGFALVGVVWLVSKRK